MIVLLIRVEMSAKVHHIDLDSLAGNFHQRLSPRGGEFFELVCRDRCGELMWLLILDVKFGVGVEWEKSSRVVLYG